MHAYVYKSLKKADTYLYLAKRDDFAGLPEPLRTQLGKLQFVLEVELAPQRKLAREDPEVVRATNLAHACCLLVAIPDAFEGGQVVEQARGANPDLLIIARAHSDAEVAHLTQLGADQVIMGEREIARSMIALLAEPAAPEPPTSEPPTSEPPTSEPPPAAPAPVAA